MMTGCKPAPQPPPAPWDEQDRALAAIAQLEEGHNCQEFLSISASSYSFSSCSYRHRRRC